MFEYWTHDLPVVEDKPLCNAVHVLKWLCLFLWDVYNVLHAVDGYYWTHLPNHTIFLIVWCHALYLSDK